MHNGLINTGHWDFSIFHGNANPFISDFMEQPYAIGTGPDMFKYLVRKQIKYGADFIKIMAAGGFASPGDDPGEMQLDRDEIKAIIEKDQKELSGNFCRGCGYCMPCPAGIEINTCARMSLLLRRSPSANQLTERGQAMMKKIEGCLHCGACMKKCPYGLNTPKLLEENYEDYKNVLAGKTLV